MALKKNIHFDWDDFLTALLPVALAIITLAVSSKTAGDGTHAFTFAILGFVSTLLTLVAYLLENLIVDIEYFHLLTKLLTVVSIVLSSIAGFYVEKCDCQSVVSSSSTGLFASTAPYNYSAVAPHALTVQPPTSELPTQL